MLKVLSKVGFITCVGLLSVVTIYTVFFPGVHRELIPYRFYYVLTNSMEPTIGTNSLVLVKTYDDSMKLEKNDIITFHANRFGEEVIIMHRFSHTEINDEGEIVYKTHPEGSNLLDIYETKREDILGVYLFHIPYVGKLILFLRSGFGILWLCQVIAILFIKRLVAAWLEEKRTISTDLLI